MDALCLNGLEALSSCPSSHAQFGAAGGGSLLDANGAESNAGGDGDGGDGGDGGDDGDGGVGAASTAFAGAGGAGTADGTSGSAKGGRPDRYGGLMILMQHKMGGAGGRASSATIAHLDAAAHTHLQAALRSTRRAQRESLGEPFEVD